MDDVRWIEGQWCLFATKDNAYGHDAVVIGQLEEVGLRAGIPYIRFRAQHNPRRVIELFGAWTVKREHTE